MTPLALPVEPYTGCGMRLVLTRACMFKGTRSAKVPRSADVVDWLIAAAVGADRRRGWYETKHAILDAGTWNEWNTQIATIDPRAVASGVTRGWITLTEQWARSLAGRLVWAEFARELPTWRARIIDVLDVPRRLVRLLEPTGYDALRSAEEVIDAMRVMPRGPGYRALAALLEADPWRPR